MPHHTGLRSRALLAALLVALGLPTACKRGASRHLNEGDEQLAHGAAAAALTEYLEALRLEPSVRAERGVGLAYAALGSLDQAQQHLEMALSVQPSDMEARLALARIYGQLGLAQEARRELETILEDQPQQPLALLLRSAYAADTAELERAAIGLEQSLERQKAHGGGAERESLIVLADLYQRLQKSELAANNTRSARLASLGSEANTLELARVCIRQKRSALAYELLRAMLDKRPSEFEGWQLLAGAALELGNTNEARLAFLHLPKERLASMDARILRARLDLAAELQVEAASELAELLELAPAQSHARRQVRYLLAKALGAERRYDDAHLQLEQLLAEAPDAFEARVLLARQALEQGRADLVQSSLRELPPVHPELAAAHELLGRAALASADFEAAARAFERLMLLAPEKPEGRYGRARALERLGRQEEARSLLSENAVQFPAHSASLHTLAELMRELDGAKAADQFSMRHWAEHAGMPEVATLEGDWWFARKQQGRALDAYKRAITLQPDFVPAVAALGRFYARRKLQAQVFSVLDAALAQQADGVQLLLVASELSAAVGSYEQARQHLERVLSVSPGYPPALAQQARLMAESHGDLDAAQKLAERAYASAPGNADVLDALGWVSYIRQDLARAREQLTLAVRYAKDIPRIRYHLAAVLLAANEPALARQNLEQVLSADPEFPDTAQVAGRARRAPAVVRRARRRH